MQNKHNDRFARYAKTHCRFYGLKLNVRTDADIIERLDREESKQGYIKQTIRADIARERTEHHEEY